MGDLERAKRFRDFYDKRGMGQLRRFAKEAGLINYSKLQKRDLVILLVQEELNDVPPEFLPNKVSNLNKPELISLTPPPSLNNNPKIVRKPRKTAKWKLENEAIAQKALNRVKKKPTLNMTFNITRKAKPPTLPKKPRSVVLKAVKAKKERVCGKYKNLNKKSKADLMRLL
jgi:hypothetical protein